MATKPDGSSKKFTCYLKFLKLLLSSAYFLLIIYIVFFARRRSHVSERHMNIVPFWNNISTFENLGADDHMGMINFYVNLCGNIIMFIPLSIVIVSIFKIYRKKTVFCTLVFLSLAIEVTQYILKIGVADIDDVILNSCGGLIGLGLHEWLQKYIFPHATYKFT